MTQSITKTMNGWQALWEARFGASEKNFETTNGHDVPANESLELLLNHRTHRRFTDTPVEPEQLDLILACAFSAPSKSDLQQVSLVHVQDPQRRQSIASLIPTMPWVGTCPEFFVFCADGRRIERIAELRGKPFVNDNLDNFLAAVCDTGLVMQAFITAAEALGLGCCPISVIRNSMEAVSEILNLPDRVIPISGMCLGYPPQAGFVSMRLPLALTCHTDQYDESAFETLLNDYDQRRDARFSLPTERQKYREEFGVAEFYGWSEDKARQMAKEERAGVGPYVRKHGYSLK